MSSEAWTPGAPAVQNSSWWMSRWRGPTSFLPSPYLSHAQHIQPVAANVQPIVNTQLPFLSKPTHLFKKFFKAIRAQEMRESWGGPPGLPVPNSPYGLCGRKATLNLNFLTRVTTPDRVPPSPHHLPCSALQNRNGYNPRQQRVGVGRVHCMRAGTGLDRNGNG